MRCTAVAGAALATVGVAAALLVPIHGRVISGSGVAQDVCTTRIDYTGDPRPTRIVNAIGDSTGRCPVPIPQSDGVPGVVDGARLGQRCFNITAYVFGRSREGASMLCLHLGGGSTDEGVWVASEPVVGVREDGATCSTTTEAAAQSPDGKPLVCSDRRWTVSALGGG